MRTHRIELEGPGVRGIVVNARLLRTVLGVLIDGSQQAVRLRTQGRSKASGTLPRWIDAATAFEVEIREGSTVLELQAPTLAEADPDAFSQGQLFPEIDPQRTSIDYLAEATEAAIGGEEDADLYDRGLLSTLRQLDDVFRHGIDSVRLDHQVDGGSRHLRLTERSLADFSHLEAKIPHPQQVRAAGYLDTIRHSDHTFTLRAPGEAKPIKGVATEKHGAGLARLWGESVLVTGLAHFTAGGRIQRIEAETIGPATDRDLEFWTVPEPVRRPLAAPALRVEQGPRSGLAAILGQWPGDESDDVIREALEQIS